MSRGHGVVEGIILDAVKGHYNGVCLSDLEQGAGELASLRRAAYRLEDEGAIVVDVRIPVGADQRRPQLHVFPPDAIILGSPDPYDPYWRDDMAALEARAMKAARALAGPHGDMRRCFDERCEAMQATWNDTKTRVGSPRFFETVIASMENERD